MKICELQKGIGNVDVEGIIISIGEVKIIDGKNLKVASAELEDSSGKVSLTLWNDDIKKFKIEDHIKITGGYVNEFQGKLQLTAGRTGKIEKVEEQTKEDIQEEKKEEEIEEAPKPKRGRPKKKVISNEI